MVELFKLLINHINESWVIKYTRILNLLFSSVDITSLKHLFSISATAESASLSQKLNATPAPFHWMGGGSEEEGKAVILELNTDFRLSLSAVHSLTV